MEAELLFQHQIASLVEEHKIPSSIIMNFDQSPLKYAPVSNSTFTKKGSQLTLLLMVPSRNQSRLLLASPTQISSYKCNPYINEKLEDVFHE